MPAQGIMGLCPGILQDQSIYVPGTAEWCSGRRGAEEGAFIPILLACTLSQDSLSQEMV